MSERPDIEKMDDWEAWETDDDYDGARELIEYIRILEAELARHHLTNGCPNTYHNEGCADSHRTVCEYR